MNRYSELRARAAEFVAEWVQWGAAVLVLGAMPTWLVSCASSDPANRSGIVNTVSLALTRELRNAWRKSRIHSAPRLLDTSN